MPLVLTMIVLLLTMSDFIISLLFILLNSVTRLKKYSFLDVAVLSYKQSIRTKTARILCEKGWLLSVMHIHNDPSQIYLEFCQMTEKILLHVIKVCLAKAMRAYHSVFLVFK